MKKNYLNQLILQLNSVSRVCAMENAPQSQKLIKQIIDSIRYRTGREGQLLKIREEIAAAKNLLGMLQFRYGDILKYTIAYSQEDLNIYVPHYTIMTFVENSIYHAFENREGTWEVGVILSQTEDTLKIIVKDNGNGFEPEKYLKLPESSCDYGTIKSTTIRLLECFGADGIVSINSSKTSGTEVVISIPKQGEGDGC